VSRLTRGDEGYDPDDPKVVAALNRVRAELAAAGLRGLDAGAPLLMAKDCVQEDRWQRPI
jgi:hypothetical protein